MISVTSQRRLQSLPGNCEIRTSSAEAALFLRAYVVAKATTHKDFRLVTEALEPAQTVRTVLPKMLFEREACDTDRGIGIVPLR
jgi:hypothetical protein